MLSVPIDQNDQVTVAASAVGAGVGDAVSQYLGGSNPVADFFKGSPLTKATTVGFAAGVATAVARGGKIEIAQIAGDAFGNALGQSLAKFALQPDQDAGTAPISKLQAERAQYGGLSIKQVLSGERNYLDALSAYNGDNAPKQAGGSWDETVAAWRADNPRYQVLPQVEIFGKSETAEYQLNAAFGFNKKVTFSDTNLPRIEAKQSIWSSYANIAGAYRNGKLGLGDAAAMAWSNTKYAYQGSQRTQGAVQVLNGILEGAGAIAISSTGVGAVLGVPLAVHGGDSIGTGLWRVWTGRLEETLTRTAAYGITGSSRAADMIDNGIAFAGAIAAAGATVPLNARQISANSGVGYTGAGTTKLDLAAEAAYADIRTLRMSDVDAVAQNSGLSLADATTMKKHLFFGRHEYPLDATTIVRQRFAADHEIAFAWNAASRGELSVSQQEWIQQLASHELAERSLMAKGIPYIQQDAWNGSRFTGGPKGAHDMAPPTPRLNFPGYSTPLHLLD